MQNTQDFPPKLARRRKFKVVVGCLAIVIFLGFGLTIYQSFQSLNGEIANLNETVGLLLPGQVAGVSTVTPVVGSNPDYNMGMAMGDTLPWLSSTDLGNQLNDIASLNIGWIRMDFDWNEIQPVSGSQYTWSNIDRVIAAANARHLKVLAILDGTPLWDRPSGCSSTEWCAPADPSAYAAFAQAAVTRYSPQGVHTWEIWNEPNLGFWKPAPDPVGYTALLQGAYTAIKSADPSAVVISAGLAPSATGGGDYSPTDFLTAMYKAGAQGYFDAVGMHPYTFPALPDTTANWNAWQQMANTSPSLRSIMTANGDGNKKIWMTEFGAPTGGPGAEANGDNYLTVSGSDHDTEYMQQQTVSDGITDRNGYSWAGPLFIYSYKDLGTSQSTNENFFGIVRSDGSDKPAYTSIQTLLGAAPAPSPSPTPAPATSTPPAKQPRNPKQNNRGNYYH